MSPFLVRVRTEIGNQNSRTFPGLFKDYLHFFQESFFIDSNSPNTAYTQDFWLFKIVNAFHFPAHCFCLISALRIVSTLLSFLPFPISILQGFISGCIDSYYLNQIESNRIQ